MEIKFTRTHKIDEIKGFGALKYAMAVAAAGRHNLMTYGAPGCGKTPVLHCMPELMPKLLDDEKATVNRIMSIAGLLGTKLQAARPFRMPHQTASIERMCGGGPMLRPGEVSLAHNGILFLDEAAEFKASVLQMLRVPMNGHEIILCRRGRSSVFPADFQLVMSMAPCPCGNLDSAEKLCLCTAWEIEWYWRKISLPLLDRIEIRVKVSRNDAEDAGGGRTAAELRKMIVRAWNAQYKRQGKLNGRLNYDEQKELAHEFGEGLNRLVDGGYREIMGICCVARTIADMNGAEAVTEENLATAVSLHDRMPEEFLRGGTE